MKLSHYRQRLDEHIARREHVDERLKEERLAIVKAEDRYWQVLEAQQIIQQVAQQIQQDAHDKIASVVSRCLSSVFAENAYEFRIQFDRKRGRTEARLLFARDGNEISPNSGSGGGVLDVASFALRLACLMLSKPAPRRLIVMDEPFKFVHSSIYRERVRLMLETLAEEMDFQFIMSTGIEDYHVGKVIEL